MPRLLILVRKRWAFAIEDRRRRFMYPSQICYACMLQMTSSQTSSIMAEKNGRFIVSFRILRQQFDLVGAIA